jgi:hypothetical protein
VITEMTRSTAPAMMPARPREVRGQMAAQLCRDAGADPDAIGRWAEIGRQRRADAARRTPPAI